MARAVARLVLTALVALGAAAGPAAAQARSLYWRALDVSARLDADGRLHVRERQAYVFTGDWNGGERTFRLRWGQELALEGVTRIDPTTGETTELSEGDLDVVDRYAWSDGTTLRWRSRRPSDPPFDETEIDYVLDYRLGDILIQTDESGYVLDHDFAFPDRPGPIQSFTLDLELDPVWEPPPSFTGQVSRGVLPPGESVVLSVPLRYRGEGAPGGVRRGASAAVRRVLALLFLLGVGGIALGFYLSERALGRFEPLDPLSSIDRSWLDEHVFARLPEEVGAAWDDRTAAPEVAAVIARMVSEGKLATTVYRTKGWFSTSENLKMKLLVRRSSLSGYERSLVDALFVSGDETSTEAIRKHYASRGFDPASKIKASLKRSVDRWLGRSSRKKRSISKKPTLGLLAASAGLALGVAAVDLSDLAALFIGAGGLLVLYLLAAGFAAVQRRRVEHLWVLALTLGLPASLVMAYVDVNVIDNSYRSGALGLAALCLFGVALVGSLFNLAKSRDGAETVRKRKKLAAARRYFQWELSRPRPRLDDAWFPYLIAFELGPAVERWFGAYGGETTTSGAGSTTLGGSTASPSGGASTPWTGGGGAFGGAGASGAWAAAVGSVAAGVTAPSSSGSSGGGGGGGGGGGSSGGGGGGGW